MSRVWYGSLDNRLEEGMQFVSEIKVGDGVTEYMWSDRHPYEVVEVKDQKHIAIRGLVCYGPGIVETEELIKTTDTDFNWTESIQTYTVRDREAGNVIDTGLTLREAENAIEYYEAEDKRDGSYTENFYEIVEEA